MSDEKEKQLPAGISTGSLSKTTIAFIKKFSPTIKKLPSIAPHLATGEVAAMEIKADGMVAVSEKLERAGYRILWKEGNIESIARIAEEYMSPDGREEKAKNLNQDWAATFADKCENTSDEEMQVRWAKILAGEADNSGTFSKKTLSVLSDMSKEDAVLFTSLCQFVWLEWNKKPLSLIYDYHNSIYNQKEIKFSTLQNLEAIGLVSTHPYHQYYLELEPVIYHYHNTAVTLQPKKHQQKDGYFIPSGEILLTQAGKELFPISGASWNDEFFNYVIDKWREEGYEPVIQNPATE